MIEKLYASGRCPLYRGLKWKIGLTEITYLYSILDILNCMMIVNESRTKTNNMLYVFPALHG